VDWSAEIVGWVSIHKTRGHEFLRRTVWKKNLLQDEIAPLSGTVERWCHLINGMSSIWLLPLAPTHRKCVHRVLVVVCAILRSRALCFVATVYL
jgi:hypothetical protein